MNRKLRIFLTIVVVILLLALDVSAFLPGVKALAEFTYEKIQNLLIVATTGVLISTIISILTLAFPEGILWNPAIVGPDANPAIVGIIKTFMIIFQPILVLWIVLIGLYLIFMTGSPAGRARAKIMFWKAIFAMILFSLSMPLFQILLDISKSLASIILNLGGVNPILGVTNLLTPILSFLTITIFVPSALTESGGIPLLITTTAIFMCLLALAVPFVILLRYVVLTFLAVLFPFALLFNFIDVPFIPLKGIGEKLIRLTFMWTFSQVVMALVLIGVSIAIANSPNLLLTVILSALGIFMVAAAPLMMTGLMKYIGATIAMIGMMLGPGIGSMMIAIGMLLMGAGPLAAMSTTGIHAMLYGFRPGATEHPLYQPGAATPWLGWGIPPMRPPGEWGLGIPPSTTPPTPTPKGPGAVEGVKPQPPIKPKIPEKGIEKPGGIKEAGKLIEDGEGQLKKGNPVAARNNFDRAFEELNRVRADDIKRDLKSPDLARAYYELGRAYERSGIKGGGDIARGCYDEAIRIDKRPEYLKALGEYYAKRG